MDQFKTGMFISELRKEKSLTQAQLAEKLGITDRAVSKWETGRSLPDAAIMLELCEILGITVNELLSGERLNMEQFDKKFEENLLEMKKQKEESDRKLLRAEIALGSISSVFFLAIIFIASFLEMPSAVRVLLIAVSFVLFFIGVFYCVRIEQVAGYYECTKCHHKYVPSYSSVLWSMHVNRTRYMKCPHCGERSWQHKVISKD
ncbi:MAG: helix-turn-helix domain-containing protein [Eubacterium sp.]|nr:helix-turn-helix domain-containing protein [Eubacterium sp.]